MLNFAHRFYVLTDDGQFQDSDYPFYVGGTGFIVKVKGAFYFITAAHSVHMSGNIESQKVRGVFLLSQNEENGKVAKVIKVVEFIKPFIKNIDMECMDLGIFKIDRDSEDLVHDYMDNSMSDKTTAVNDFSINDEMIVMGFPFRPNTVPLDFENKKIDCKPSMVFIKYNGPDKSDFIHSALFDQELNGIFGSDVTVMDGFSGGPVFLKKGLSLGWAGMIISSGNDRIRFIHSKFIDEYLLKYG